MRGSVVLITASVLAALPLPVLAQGAIKCEFQGNSIKVVVTNGATADKQCSYLCKYSLQLGEAQISGSSGVKAGESKTVDEGTRSGKITGVKESSVRCE